ncbi:Uncharacterised protein [Mycoplasmopsis californica]|uniref:ECF transporter S component n=1 Tax=Mycoplasmopsis equigenitalium TaxID=114883 RepID=A0ABY5J5U2_9BACT|nr:hypothetical protein [Mycoplasmopsis equigenitalium]UUD37058.1 hypothetical protein NPA09_00570 [Mycoplasmopsis equigenitalium]VEU69642.1 Uncharacterised protein [Mycoplasmopsis californica]
MNIVWVRTKSAFKFNVFEIAISGMLLTMFLLATAIAKLSLGRIINLSIEIPFWIIFGILLGAIKGSFLAVIADTLSMMLLSPSGLAFWMIEYAIVPPAIVIISSVLFYFYTKHKVPTTLVISSILYLVLAINIAILVTNQNRIYKSDNSDSFPRALILWLTVGFSLLIAFFTCFMVVGYFVTKKINEKIIKYLFLFAIVSVIIVIFRWLYGPYVFIVYWNRFMANTSTSSGKLRLEKDYSLYAFYQTRIILKSMIEIPFFTLVMIPISSVLLILKEKTYNSIYENKW